MVTIEDCRHAREERTKALSNVFKTLGQIESLAEEGNNTQIPSLIALAREQTTELMDAATFAGSTHAMMDPKKDDQK